MNDTYDWNPIAEGSGRKLNCATSAGNHGNDTDCLSTTRCQIERWLGVKSQGAATATMATDPATLPPPTVGPVPLHSTRGSRATNMCAMEGNWVAKLGPFIRICQICGFVPFRAETDAVSKIPLGFSFSLRDPLLWWFLLLKAYNVSGLVVGISMELNSIFQRLNSDQHFFACIGIVQVITIFLTQLAVFRCSHLRRAIELIHKADEAMAPVSKTHASRDGITRRILTDVSLCLCLVKTSHRYLTLTL